MHARVDVDVLDRNIAGFHRLAAASGVRVRPHVKGHRSVEIWARQQAAGATGPALTQVSQARHYVAAGADEVVIAFPWRDPWRLALIAGLARTCRVTLHVDDAAAVEPVAAAAARAGVQLGVRVQLGGAGRVDTTSPDDAVHIAQAVDRAGGLHLDGVTGYCAPLDPQDFAVPAEVGRAAAGHLVAAAARIVDAGLPCDTVTMGGTPTAAGAMTIRGVTEVCAGAYALHDVGLARLGFGSLDDIALSMTCDDAADDAALDSYPYPWVRTADRVARDGAVLPPHICSALLHLDTVDASGGTGSTGEWPVHNELDAAP